MSQVLGIHDLRLSFRRHAGTVEVLHGIDLTINRAERVALVGESGSGKSVTARLVLGLLQQATGARVSGRIDFEGRDLDEMPAGKRAALRGRRMAMIFQDPTSSLNPTFTIGQQFVDVLRRANPRIGASAARMRAAALLDEVAIRDPARVLDAYPFQLSGGMNQRVVIAMAMANDPALLLADEPGTALDVTVQAQTLALMRGMADRHQTAVLFISHNLGVVREFADRIYVIYRGRIVEDGSTAQVFDAPRHPYTRALIEAVPRLTGGGLPDITDASPDFLASAVHHEGAA